MDEERPIFEQAREAANDVWVDAISDDDGPSELPDPVLKRILISSYQAAYRVLAAEMCPRCAHRAAYQIATGDVRVSFANPVSALN